MRKAIIKFLNKALDWLDPVPPLNKDELMKDIEELLTKHDMQSSIILTQRRIDKTYRVMAVSQDPEFEECQFATLFSGCVQISKGFRDILEHVSRHSAQELIKKLGAIPPMPKKEEEKEKLPN